MKFRYDFNRIEIININDLEKVIQEIQTIELEFSNKNINLDVIEILPKIIDNLFQFVLFNFNKLTEPLYRLSNIIQLIIIKISYFYNICKKYNNTTKEKYQEMKRMTVRDYIFLKDDLIKSKNKPIIDYNIIDFISIINTYEGTSKCFKIDKIDINNLENFLNIIKIKFFKLILSDLKIKHFIEGYTEELENKNGKLIHVNMDFIFDFSLIICKSLHRILKYKYLNIGVKTIKIKKGEKAFISNLKKKILNVKEDYLTSNSTKIVEEIKKNYLKFMMKYLQLSKYLREEWSNKPDNFLDIFSIGLIISSIVSSNDDEIMKKLTIDKEIKTTLKIFQTDNFFDFKNNIILNNFLNELFFIKFSKEKLFSIKNLEDVIVYNTDISEMNNEKLADLKTEIRNNYKIIQDFNNFNFFYKNTKYVCNDFITALILYFTNIYDKERSQKIIKELIID